MSQVRIFKKKQELSSETPSIPICIAPWLDMQEAEKTVEVLQIILQKMQQK
jgi:hypothetical protein